MGFLSLQTYEPTCPRTHEMVSNTQGVNCKPISRGVRLLKLGIPRGESCEMRTFGWKIVRE